MHARDLMDVPAGTERAGDEFHDPDAWRPCPNCGRGLPGDVTTCYCGATLEADR